MSIDPNEPQGELPIEPVAPEPEPAAPAPGVDVDTLADRVIEKLMSAAQTAAPEAQTQTYQQAGAGNVIQTLQAQAADPNHPLYAQAVATLQVMRSQGEEQEWAQLGCPPGHPARSMFAQNPAAFNGFPRFAFTAWELSETKRGANDRAREAARLEKEREAAAAVRSASPAMPSRSVEPKTGSGRLQMTHAEFERRVINEPDLDDKADRGLIDWI